MYIPNPTARFGEDKAVKFLISKGYKILERNFRKGYGEIDIVATKENTLVFIEVKTRYSKMFGGAMGAISKQKLKNLVKTASFYKSIHPNLPEALRIDAVLINLEKSGYVSEIKHIENISGF